MAKVDLHLYWKRPSHGCDSSPEADTLCGTILSGLLDAEDALKYEMMLFTLNAAEYAQEVKDLGITQFPTVVLVEQKTGISISRLVSAELTESKVKSAIMAAYEQQAVLSEETGNQSESTSANDTIILLGANQSRVRKGKEQGRRSGLSGKLPDWVQVGLMGIFLFGGLFLLRRLCGEGEG